MRHFHKVGKAPNGSVRGKSRKAENDNNNRSFKRRKSSYQSPPNLPNSPKYQPHQVLPPIPTQPKFPLSMGDSCRRIDSNTAPETITETDVEEIVRCLLERLNSLANELNEVSILKETAEKELESNQKQIELEEEQIIQRYFLHQTKRHSTSNDNTQQRNDIISLIDQYFRLILELCLKQIEQQQLKQSISDIEDELGMVRDIVETFDGDDDDDDNIDTGGCKNNNCFAPVDCLWNISSLNNSKLEINQGKSSSDDKTTVAYPPSVAVRQEIVHQMKCQKLPQLFHRIMVLQDKIQIVEIEFDQTRAQLAHICQNSWAPLHSIMPSIWHYFDLRLSQLSLWQNLPILTRKCQQKRALYAKTMENLGLISCYVRQMRKQSQECEPDNKLC